MEEFVRKVLSRYTSFVSEKQLYERWLDMRENSDVRDAFLAGDARAATAFVPTRPGHWTVDLYALARQRLVAAGVSAAAIHGGDQCTISQPVQFFSHRRDRRSGRMASLIWMAD